jgi:hypothetical protein
MKRSQAIDIIISNLERCLRIDQLAYEILCDLEDAGMLPPDNGKEAYDVLDYRSKCLKWDEE